MMIVILFGAEDAIGVSRLNREIMDFLAIAEPVVTMEIKEAANRGEFGFWWSSKENKKVADILFSDKMGAKSDNKFMAALLHSLKEAGYKVKTDCIGGSNEY